MIKAPRRLLLNDEGSSAVHYLDLDAPGRNWTFNGPGRDLQLIGDQRVLRSTPSGFVELDLASGKLLREVTAPGLGAIESARRLPNGHSVLLGNTDGGIVIGELDASGNVLESRQLRGAGLAKGRLIRHTTEGSVLFCSETDGKRLIHEADLERGVRTLFQIPDDVAADSMLKATRIGKDRIAVSTGYAASLLIIDTALDRIVQTIGGKRQAEPSGLRRRLSPHFFSGFQLLRSGDYLIANWQGHGPSHAGEGYQLLGYTAAGELSWTFDQVEFPYMTSLNNVIALDELDSSRLCDERGGVLQAV